MKISMENLYVDIGAEGVSLFSANSAQEKNFLGKW